MIFKTALIKWAVYAFLGVSVAGAAWQVNSWRHDASLKSRYEQEAVDAQKEVDQTLRDTRQRIQEIRDRHDAEIEKFRERLAARNAELAKDRERQEELAAELRRLREEAAEENEEIRDADLGMCDLTDDAWRLLSGSDEA